MSLVMFVVGYGIKHEVEGEIEEGADVDPVSSADFCLLY